ncbi:hypothetical protein MNAN1_000064 [Malassezia nana]|uniref:Uncharacterized protein n=1 Tax=Malassezia nana TaxID=180528 RepID=A0AAF0J0K7_9BASI|nr:hypothetical protein MNAN1_000064 [Malassezia nana]
MKRIAERQIQREDGDDPHSFVEDAPSEGASAPSSREAAPRVIRGLPKRKGLAPSPSAPALSANPFSQLSSVPSSGPLFSHVQLAPATSSAPTKPANPAPLPTSVSQPVLPAAPKAPAPAPAPAPHAELEYWKGLRGLNWSMIRHFIRVWNASDELADLHATLVQFAETYQAHHDALAKKWLGHALHAPAASSATESSQRGSIQAPVAAGTASKDPLPSSAPAFSHGELSQGKPASTVASQDKQGLSKDKPAFSFGAVPDKPTTFGSLHDKPAFSFGALSKEKPASNDKSQDKPTVSFGMNKDKPAFSFGASQDKPTLGTESKTGPTFSFGASKDKPAFSFGTTKEKPASSNESQDKPAFSFGTLPKDKPAPSGDSQEKQAAPFGTTKDKPAFSFGMTKETSASSDESQDKPIALFGMSKDKPAFSFGASQDKPALGTESKTVPTFSFGASKDKPAFSFGTLKEKPASSNESQDKPAFAFGQSKEKPASNDESQNKLNISFSASQDKPAFGAESKAAPTFSFGTSKDKAAAFGASQARPAFSFGVATKDQPASGFSLHEKPASFGGSQAKPAFSFGTPKDPQASLSESTSMSSTGPNESEQLSDSAKTTTSKESNVSAQDAPLQNVQPASSSSEAPAQPVDQTYHKKPKETTQSAPAFSFGATPTPSAFSFSSASTESSHAKNSSAFSFGSTAPSNGEEATAQHESAATSTATPAAPVAPDHSGSTKDEAAKPPALELPTLPRGGFSFAGQAVDAIIKAPSQGVMEGVKAPALSVPSGGFTFGACKPAETPDTEARDAAEASSLTPAAETTNATTKDLKTPLKKTATTKPIAFGSATPPHARLPFGAAGSPPVAPHRFSFGSSPKEDASPFTKAAIGPSFANTTGVTKPGSFHFGETPIAFGAPPSDRPSEDEAPTE